MYSDQERLIYKLPIGNRFGDPLAILRRLRIASGGRVNDYLADWEGGDEPAASVAEEELVKAARVAFQLEPLSPLGGVSDADVLETLQHFTDHLSKPASAAATPPTSPPSTDCRS